MGKRGVFCMASAQEQPHLILNPACIPSGPHFIFRPSLSCSAGTTYRVGEHHELVSFTVYVKGSRLDRAKGTLSHAS